jgi:hypothetical protein
VVSLLLGLVGAVLPLLPTTPFLLLAAFGFARSSPRLHGWLMAHRQFGPMIRNWEQYGAIDRRSKRVAVIVIALTPVITWLAGAPYWALATQIAVLAVVAAFILTRPVPEVAKQQDVRT